MFGEFPDGFRMTYQALWDVGSVTDIPVHQAAFDKLVHEHGGQPKMFYSEDGVYA